MYVNEVLANKLSAIKSGFEEMKKINLGLASVKTIEKLDDKLKMLWLMVKYGTTNVLKIIGFQFYAKEQPVIEVNNKVYFSKNLLEWQCSLA